VIALTDRQLELVMTVAAELPVEKRSLLLERIAARLRLVGPRFNDRDLALAVRLGLRGLDFTAPRPCVTS
jgi:hypothetical protein